MPKKILIVDDERMVVDFLAGLLKMRGHDVFKAHGSMAAAEELDKNAPIDLALLDMRLLGADGLDILRLLRRDYPRTKVIVITGYDSEYKDKAEKIGCEAFFSKPILIAELTERIDGLLAPDGGKVADSAPSSGGTGRLFQADIVIIEERSDVLKLLLKYFSRKEYCGAGGHRVRSGAGEQPTDTKDCFVPEIVLFDIAVTKTFGEYSSVQMGLKTASKEVISFGEPVSKWDELDVMLRRRIVSDSAILEGREHVYYRMMLDRLNRMVASACIRHGLYEDNP